MRLHYLLLLLLLVACQPQTATVSLLIEQPEAQPSGPQPTLDDLWEGRAEFLLDVPDSGLPMGESETILLENGHLWSYVHASDRSAGTIDQCGAPVEFPGCTVIYRSFDGGDSFAPEEPPICQFACNQCPCDAADHISQQQYPDVAYYPPSGTLFLVYENGGTTYMRTSPDGIFWSGPERVGETGHWRTTLRDCAVYERIGEHPFVPYDFECLSGGPPGIFIEGSTVYVFVGMGQSPGHMGCWKGSATAHPSSYTRCEHNPLFAGAREYGPFELRGRDANPWWDFRTISSADVVALGTGLERRFYMVYEGLRGPGPGDPGDTQFGLGLARSLSHHVDGPWETFDGNPILVNSPANIGIGHADIVVLDDVTYLYTSLDGVTRSRLRLMWIDESDKAFACGGGCAGAGTAVCRDWPIRFGNAIC